jgi:hypothetical protein
MFGLLVMFGHRCAEPSYGNNTGLVPGFTTCPTAVESVRRLWHDTQE